MKILFIFYKKVFVFNCYANNTLDSFHSVKYSGGLMLKVLQICTLQNTKSINFSKIAVKNL